MARLRESDDIEVTFVPHNPRLPGPLRLLQRIKYVRTIATTTAYVALLCARTPRCRVVHTFSASYFSYLLCAAPALLIARLFGKAAILNYHSGEAADHLRRSRWITRGTMRLAHAIVVQSGYLAGVFREHGLTTVVIPNIVDVDRFRFRPRPNPRARLLTTRNLEPLYNVSCVLDAFAIVQSARPDATLTVAGIGSQADALREQARRLGLRDVRFVGAVDHARVPDLYDDHDLYVMAPNIDNTPLSVIESWAAGVPVVSSDAGGIPHLVDSGRTGLLVQRDDAPALAAACLRLLDEHSLYTQLAGEAHDRVAAFTWAAIGPAWRALYAQLARGERTRLAEPTGAAAPGRH
jgi:glycosyltransferase involved in cell wall biosynthesis